MRCSTGRLMFAPCFAAVLTFAIASQPAYALTDTGVTSGQREANDSSRLLARVLGAPADRTSPLWLAAEEGPMANATGQESILTAPGVVALEYAAEQAMEGLRNEPSIFLRDFVLASPDADPPLIQVDMVLERIDVFSATSTVVAAHLHQGELVEIRLPFPDVLMFRGHVMGHDNSRVFLSFSRFGVHGYVMLEGRTHVLSPGPHDGNHTQLIYLLDALPQGTIRWHDFLCEAVAAPEQGAAGVAGAGAAAGDSKGTCHRVRIAIETDTEFTINLFGGDLEAASTYVVTWLGAMSEIFSDAINVTFDLGFLRLWNGPDSWNAGGIVSQLIQFQDVWNETMSTVDRHVAHFLSGRSLGGGAAYTAALCEIHMAYSLTANLNGFFPYPLQDNSPQNWDVFGSAHELGHNFGTVHTHQYCPPLDQCAPPLYHGPCQVRTSCSTQGTIMSYCFVCSGDAADIVLQFHPVVETTMSNFVDSLAFCDIPTGNSEGAIAMDDDAITFQDEPVTINVLANDLPGPQCSDLTMAWFDRITEQGGTVELVEQGAGGQVALQYTPPNQFADVDSFDYAIFVEEDQLSVATVTIQVTPACWDVAIGQPGMDNEVLALAAYDGDIIAAGTFTTAGGVDVNRIARRDSVSGQWHSLAGGANNQINALYVHGGDLIAGGAFTMIGGKTIDRIARWDGSEWHSLGTGFNAGFNGPGSGVLAIGEFDGELIAAGGFTASGAQPIARIARWDSALEEWKPFGVGLGTGSSQRIHAVATFQQQLYAGGRFAVDDLLGPQVARWDPDSGQWEVLGGLSGAWVLALAAHEDSLFVGGSFTVTTGDGQSLNSIARVDGASGEWTSAGALTGGIVMGFGMHNGDLLTTGGFSTAEGITVNRVARWDGAFEKWQPPSDPNTAALSDQGRAIIGHGDEIVVGGRFQSVDSKPANRITRLVQCHPQATPVGDLDGDGAVNVFDLLMLLAAWGACNDCAPGACPADLDDNCTVNVFDLFQLLANWG